jgi:hypothetical protein
MGIGERLDKVGAVWIISPLGEHALASILENKRQQEKNRVSILALQKSGMVAKKSGQESFLEERCTYLHALGNTWSVGLERIVQSVGDSSNGSNEGDD